MMRLVLVLVLALSAVGICQAEPLSFVKTGGLYYVLAGKDVPLPGGKIGGAEAYNATSIKVIKAGGGQWYLVEYDEWSGDAQSGPITVYKRRAWFNFAQATVITPEGTIDYAATFPKGYKIISLKVQ